MITITLSIFILSIVVNFFLYHQIKDMQVFLQKEKTKLRSAINSFHCEALEKRIYKKASIKAIEEKNRLLKERTLDKIKLQRLFRLIRK